MTMKSFWWAWNAEASPLAKLVLLYAADSWCGYSDISDETISLDLVATAKWCGASIEDVCQAFSEISRLNLGRAEIDGATALVQLAFVDDLRFHPEPSGQSRTYIPKSIKDRVMLRDGRKCVACGSVGPLQFDHKLPVSRGGDDTFENLQLLCESCNKSKGARTMEEWGGREIV